MATFHRRNETHFGVTGVAFRVDDGDYSRDLEVERGSIAESIGGGHNVVAE